MNFWHPLFAQLLRHVVEKHYEVQTDVPVGDVPRQADFVLLRRTSAEPATFHGLWRFLTTWSVLEYKGATVSARVRDLDLLVEVGLGIDRRLNEERAKQHQRLLPPEEVSFWYVANDLGNRCLRDARARLGRLTPEENGVWRCELLQRPLFLVSSATLPLEQDNLPLNVLAANPPEVERAVAEFVIDRPGLWEVYGIVLMLLHKDLIEELAAMGKTINKGFKPDWTVLLEIAGEKEVLREIIDKIGIEKVKKSLPPKKKKTLLESLLEDYTPEESLESVLAKLTPEKRREVLRARMASEQRGESDPQGEP